MATSIQQTTTKKTNRQTIKDYINQMSDTGVIKAALPSVLTPERFTRMALSALTATPGLDQCSPNSFVAAMLNAAQLGLEPNTPLGQAYLLPYKTRNGDVCQFILGYKGLIDLAYRSGDIEVIQAHMVYEHDTFECSYGLEPTLKHTPADGDRGIPKKVYALFKTKSGGYGFEVMSVDECRRIGEKFSKSYNSSFSPWQTNFEEMCKKTVLKRVLKYAPMKSDFVRAASQDETVKSEISSDMIDVRNDVIVTDEYTEVPSSEEMQEV